MKILSHKNLNYDIKMKVPKGVLIIQSNKYCFELTFIIVLYSFFKVMSLFSRLESSSNYEITQEG